MDESNDGRSTTTSSSGEFYFNRESRALLILALTISTVCVVLTLILVVLCCYFYRHRLRRNYPLSMIPSSVVPTIATPPGTSTEDSENEPSAMTLTRGKKMALSDENFAFDNPVYRKASPNLLIESSSMTTIDRPTVNEEQMRRTPSPGCDQRSITDAMSVMEIGESTSNDRRLLVPNDWLSLEIDRGQRWLRASRMQQQKLYESGALDAGRSPSPLEVAEAVQIEVAELDRQPTPTPMQLQQPMEPLQPLRRKRLPKRMAELIAGDQLMETMVNLSNDYRPFGDDNLSVVHQFDNEPIGHNNNNDDDGDDLEIIFRERTPL